MKKAGIADVLGEIDERYIAEAHADRPRRRIGLRICILAACLCLLIGGTTAYAASGQGAWITAIFTHREESGYDLALDVARIADSELSAELRAVGRVIVRQYKDSKPYDSHYPGSWYKSFDASADARDFVGYAPLIGLDWMPEEGGTQLSVTGTPDGRLQWVHLETEYTVGSIHLQAFTWLYTEHYTGDLTTGLRAAEEVSFTETEETNAAGRTWLLVRSSPMESGWAGLDGYLVRDGILYKLHIAHLPEDTAEAERLMREWADCF